jgi:hypothetical protein
VRGGARRIEDHQWHTDSYFEESHLAVSVVLAEILPMVTPGMEHIKQERVWNRTAVSEGPV